MFKAILLADIIKKNSKYVPSNIWTFDLTCFRTASLAWQATLKMPR